MYIITTGMIYLQYLAHVIPSEYNSFKGANMYKNMNFRTIYIHVKYPNYTTMFLYFKS